MHQQEIDKYSSQLLKLNRGYNKGLGRAPHKPILLLSVIKLIQEGTITSNKIFITTELLLEFKDNWKKLVDTNHTSNFALPFFHLRSEPFWYLVTRIGLSLKLTNSKSIKSFKSLNENIAFAEIDKNLFKILTNQLHSSYFVDLLLNKYFPSTKSNYYSTEVDKTESEIENQILNEDKSEYQKHITELKTKLTEDELDEEFFIRGGLFKKAIPKIYEYKCCISEMKIENNHNFQMIDACHIIPFSLSNDDTIPNGISLSPTLHRAFDRGLITINDDYVVRISPTISENENSPFSLKQFEGKQIMLPKKQSHFPSIESLSWHRKELFKL